MFSYCVAKDKENEKIYLVSFSLEEIETYCQGNDLEILSRPKYVEPAMVAHHFIWVGKEKRPPIIEISTHSNKEVALPTNPLPIIPIFI